MLIPRILTALALLAILIPIVTIGPAWLWGLTSLLMLGIAYAEWARLVSRSNPGPVEWFALLLGGSAVVALAPTGDLAQPLVIAICFLSLLFWVVEGPRRLRRHHAASGGRVLAAALLAACWLALYDLRGQGAVVLVSAMAIVWVADVAAYFVGRAIGRHKLAPSISPGKSWEGAIAGMAAVALAGLATVPFEAMSSALPARLVGSTGWVGAAAVLALLAALSIVGDLFESLLKRQAGVKDSGNVLPGHGGVLDRIDALIPTMPAVALIAELLG